MFIDNLITEDIHYIFAPLSFFNAEWKWDDTKFSALPKNKLILVNCAAEHWGMDNFIENLYDRLDQLNLNFLNICSINNKIKYNLNFFRF